MHRNVAKEFTSAGKFPPSTPEIIVNKNLANDEAITTNLSSNFSIKKGIYVCLLIFFGAS